MAPESQGASLHRPGDNGVAPRASLAAPRSPQAYLESLVGGGHQQDESEQVQDESAARMEAVTRTAKVTWGAAGAVASGEGGWAGRGSSRLLFRR